MDNDVKTRILEWISKVESGGDFVAQQAPEVASQYVDFVFYTSIIQIVVCVLLMILFGSLAAYLAFIASKRDEVCLVFSLIVFSPAVVAFGFAIDGSVEAFKAYVAPKVLVLEKLSDIVKGN